MNVMIHDVKNMYKYLYIYIHDSYIFFVIYFFVCIFFFINLNI